MTAFTLGVEPLDMTVTLTRGADFVTTLRNPNASWPAAASATVGTELLATAKSCRNKIDLSRARFGRLVGMVIANGNVAGAAYKLSYCTAENTTWASGTGVADLGPSLVVGSTGGSTGVLHDTGWVALATAGQIDNCFITLLVGVALGTTPPTVGQITAYFR